MASYVLLSDFMYKGRRMFGGDVLSDEAGDDIADLLAKGAPLVTHTLELAALAVQLRRVIPDEHAAAGLLTTTAGGSRTLKPDVNGIANLYVDGANGDDANDGLTSARPLATILAAWRRVSEWLLLLEDRDLVVHVANGTYEEYLDFVFPVAPRRRVIFLADRTDMTVVDSGTCDGSTTTTSISDATKAWVVDAHGALLVRTWDPTDEAATEQIALIRENTATAVSPSGQANAGIIAGWLYEILRPGVIVKDAAGSGRSFTARCVLPWQVPSYVTSDSGPNLHFAFMEFRYSENSGHSVFLIAGGSVTLVGCLVNDVAPNGAWNGISGEICTIETGRYPSIADPVYGLGPWDVKLADCGIGFIGDGYASIAFRLDAADFAGPVALNATNVYRAMYVFRRSRAEIHGGANISNDMIYVAPGGNIALYGGGAFYDHPFLVKNGDVAAAFRVQGECWINADILELKSLAGTAFYVDLSFGLLELDGDVKVAAAGDVPGQGVYCRKGGEAMVNASVGTGGATTFKSTGANLRAGDVEGTFVSLTPSAPLYDLPADSAGDTAVLGRAASTDGGSMARIYEPT